MIRCMEFLKCVIALKCPVITCESEVMGPVDLHVTAPRTRFAALGSNIAAVLRKSASTNTAEHQPTTSHDSDDGSEETQIVLSDVKKQGIIPT